MIKNIFIGVLITANIILLYFTFIKFEYIFDNNKIVKINKQFINVYPKFYQDRYLFEINNNYKYIINNYSLLSLFLQDTLLSNIQINSSYEFILDLNKFSLIKINNNYDPTYLLYRNYSYKLNEYNIFDIEYPLDSNGKYKLRLFSINKENSNCYYTYYIKWVNKDAINFKNLNQNTNEIYPQQEGYIWGINKTTDTIETNLNYYTIKKIFKDFNGEYIFKKYKGIEIKGNLEIYEENTKNYIRISE